MSRWNAQLQKKQAAAMGVNSSSLCNAIFNLLDIREQGTYAA